MGLSQLPQLETDLFPLVKVTRATAQTIAHNTITAVSWSSAPINTDAMWEGVTNPTRLTVVRSGVYVGAFGVRWGTASAGFRVLRPRLNGTTFIPTTVVMAASLSIGHEQAVPIMEIALVAGDFIEGTVFHTQGVDLTLDPQPWAPFMSLRMVREL